MHKDDEYRPPKNPMEALSDLEILIKELNYDTHRKLDLIIKRINHMSAQVDRVKAAVATLVTEVGEASAEIAKLAQAVRDAAQDPAELEAIAVQIEAQAKALDDSVAAANQPAPAPEPAPEAPSA
jgi:chromosome segregation ATPase